MQHRIIRIVSRHSWRRRTCLAISFILACPLSGLSFAQEADSSAKFLVVDCLLPGQVRKLGRRMTYLTPRRPVRTTASECEIRGGEYVSYDRADYQTAFRIWMPAAQGGDAKAQSYVGEIAEKGLGRQPDYSMAALWYQKAAEQGYAPALVNLAHLYESGLGVAKDPSKAEALYRRAAQIPAGLAALVHFGDESANVSELTPNYSSARESAPNNNPLAEQQADLAALRRENEGLAVKASEAASLKVQVERDRAEIAAERAELEAARKNAQGAADRSGQLTVELAATQTTITALTKELEQTKVHAKAAAVNADAENDAARRVASLQAQLVAMRAERDQAVVSASDALAAISSREAALAKREGALQSVVADQSSDASLAVGPKIELIEPEIRPTRGEIAVVLPPNVHNRTIVGRATASDGLLMVSVNGIRTKLWDDGMFESELAIPASGLPVEIVAIDKKGRRSEMLVSLRYDRIASQASIREAKIDWSRLKMGAQHALLIGNSKYNSLPVLTTPGRDVDAIATVLHDHYGFQVTVLHDATRYQIMSALNQLREKLTEKDDLLIYYAGHGQMVSMAQRDRGYWLPIESEQANTASWISNADITDAVASMSVHKVLLVADSCYSGLLTRSSLERLDAGASPEARADFLETLAEQKSRNVFTSGGDVPVLDVGGGVYSIFAKAFLSALRNNNEPLQGQELAKLVSQSVSYSAKELDFQQLPQYGPLQLAGHESGDYLFVPVN